jgi:hypothetical protein
MISDTIDVPLLTKSVEKKTQLLKNLFTGPDDTPHASPCSK